jgi:hypothetical protein
LPRKPIKPSKLARNLRKQLERQARKYKRRQQQPARPTGDPARFLPAAWPGVWE